MKTAVGLSPRAEVDDGSVPGLVYEWSTVKYSIRI